MTEAKRVERSLWDAEMIGKMSDESLEDLLTHLKEETFNPKAFKNSKYLKAPKAPEISEEVAGAIEAPEISEEVLGAIEAPENPEEVLGAIEAPENPEEVLGVTEAPKISGVFAWKEIRGLLVKIAVITLIFVTIFTFMFGAYRNTDPYMAPMVKNGDLVLYYRLDKNYAIGDLLLLEFQGEHQVRRVVAKEGDEVDISEEGIHINGALQQEIDIYQETWAFEEGVEFPITVGEGQVFVLGDTREDAIDSRIYGPTEIKDTLGTVMTIVRRRNL